MKCPCCGAAELIHETRDISLIFRGKTFAIHSVTGDFCPGCGEGLLNGEESARYIDLVSAFRSSAE